MDRENGKVRGSQNSLEFFLWEVEETQQMLRAMCPVDVQRFGSTHTTHWLFNGPTSQFLDLCLWQEVNTYI